MVGLFYCPQKRSISMIHISNITDCHLIDNPELRREVTSYLLYCRHELLEYEDEEDVDDHDFNFMVLGKKDVRRAVFPFFQQGSRQSKQQNLPTLHLR